eukprot:5417044-Pyramimonas_sp.AAC.1
MAERISAMSLLDRAMRRMSSTHRKLFSRSSPFGSSETPRRLAAHFPFTLFIIYSDTQLKSSELNGTPCFVPRSIRNSLLKRSVLTAAVCWWHSFWSRVMYGG